MEKNLPNVLHPYVELIIGNTPFYYDKSSGAPNFFVSLSHKRVVDGANNTTITITYSPKTGEDPDYVEKAIVGSKGYCCFRYGHVPQNLTRYYQGLITDYRISFGQGTITYTLTVLSYAYISRNMVVAKCYDLKNSFDYTQNDADKIAKEIVDEYLSEFYEYDESRSDAKGTQIKGDSLILNFGGHSPLESLQDLAKSLEDAGVGGNSYYVIVVDDSSLSILNASSAKGKIYIKRVEATQASPYKSNYTFDWNHRNGDILGWNVEYQGAVAIFRNINQETIFLKSNKQGFVENKQVSSFCNQMSGSLPNYTETSLPDEDWWVKNAEYPYKATLNIIGVPSSDLQIGDNVKVNYYVNNIMHHTSGTYGVLGIKDEVSSSGFSTTYELYRTDKSATQRTVTKLTTSGTWLGSGAVRRPDGTVSSIPSEAWNAIVANSGDLTY